MPERIAVSPEFLSEILEALKRIERGVSLVAWLLAISAAVGASRAQMPRS